MKDVKTYNAVFKNIYQYMERHINASTDDELARGVAEREAMPTQFEKDMALAVLQEVERINLG